MVFGNGESPKKALPVADDWSQVNVETGGKAESDQ
jgi:hypothetical protein